MEEVWNGEVMRGLRRSLAARLVPDYCMANGHCCPLVLEERAKAVGRTPPPASAELRPSA